MDSDLFRHLLGQFATGVTVITTNADGRLHGMTANAFCSVSLIPPLVLVCVDRSANCAVQVRAAGRFGVNVLGADQQDLSDQFARTREPEEGRLGEVPFQLTLRGTPELLGALAFLDCDLRHDYDGGDHHIFVGELIDGHSDSDERGPLLYFRGRYGGLTA